MFFSEKILHLSEINRDSEINGRTRVSITEIGHLPPYFTIKKKRQQQQKNQQNRWGRVTSPSLSYPAHIGEDRTTCSRRRWASKTLECLLKKHDFSPLIFLHSLYSSMWPSSCVLSSLPFPSVFCLIFELMSSPICKGEATIYWIV